MNLLATTAILALSASGTNAVGDFEVNVNSKSTPRFNTHMWMFGENGVSIFTPEGQEVKTLPPEHVCKNVTADDGSSRLRCDFNDVVSDGNKYVWASVARGVPKIDVFRIDTGDLVGSFGTCGSPRDLDVHPLREEVWVHCSEYSNISASHMDVFSATSPSAPIVTTITMHDNTPLRSFGKLSVHGSLGDVGYSTVTGFPSLFKIDLAERRVLEEIDLQGDNPKFYGLYDVAFSPKNGHIYARTEVCCTCGFLGADTLECGRYGSVNITIGGEDTEGQCGRHCRGGPTDTIGVIEFDTNTDTVVGVHSFVGEAPVYEPFSSPDGEHIILFGLDGGRTVEILKAGESGMKSELEHVLLLDFNTTNVEEYGVYDDFAYVQMANMNYIVVSSSADYKVAIVDMDTLNVDYVILKDIPYEGRRSSRQVEWAEGTKYVWIGGRSDDEAYIIDLETKQVIKTFEEVDARKLLSVSPYHFMGMADGFGSYFTEQGIFVSDNAVIANAIGSTDRVDSSSRSDALSIVALALSCVAIGAVLVNTFVSKPKQMSAAATEAATTSGAPLKKDYPEQPEIQDLNVGA